MNDYSTDQMRDRSPTVTALDNMIRRKLRVSDPSDAEEIARALRQYYRADTQAMEREASGLPFLMTPMPAAAPPAATSSQAEIEQALSDVERDLTTLKTSSILKDIQPELQGWETAIRAAIADALSAARQGLDPRQRDLAFANRRLLGDYARIARFVGALTPMMSIYYRNLAQSLDEVSSVILVLMGEVLANMGYAGGRFLMQVTVSELQQRRDAVIYSLRNLVGSAQEAYGPQDWPRGLVAYRQFLDRLETSGLTDLRALFQENNVARLMDDLIHRAAGGQAEGVRALGATAQMSLDSLRRLLLFGQQIVSPESPPLVAFLSAVQLFLDAFVNAASGYRMLFIARPPIVYYGLYGLGGPDDATRQLLELTIKRGQLAQMLDCYLGCNCCADDICCQILLDKVLYDLDRAIDLYALGTDPNGLGGEGEPERRAAAYGFIIEAIQTNPNLQEKCFRGWCLPSPENVIKGQPSTACDDPCRPIANLGGKLWDLLDKIKGELKTGVWPALPDDLLTQELCMQRNAEDQWEQLLLTMTPSCVGFNDSLLHPTQCIIDAAIAMVGGHGAVCPPYAPKIPATVETSLEGILNDVSPSGEGRQP